MIRNSFTLLAVGLVAAVMGVAITQAAVKSPYTYLGPSE